jgi:hypothetical protein
MPSCTVSFTSLFDIHSPGNLGVYKSPRDCVRGSFHDFCSYP